MFENITVPQFDATTGGLKFIGTVIYVFSGIIIFAGLMMVFGKKDIKISDGIMVSMIGVVVGILGFVFMKFGVGATEVVLYTNKIELSKNGKVQKSFPKQDILSIRAIESKKYLKHQPVIITHIPFESLDTVKNSIRTYGIFIENKANKDKQGKINLGDENAIFLHNNPETLAWIRKHYKNLLVEVEDVKK